jgi:L-iditol 2-dehydrogenase
MRALVYSDWETLQMADVPMPEPAPGEVLVRVQAAGICGSELEAVRKHSPRRPPPLILGHEFTGVIEATGEGVKEWNEGDEIVANAVIADGRCPSCRRGDTHLCLHRQLFGMHRPGAFAEYVTVPAVALIKRPAGVVPAAAALTEPLANGVHIAGLLADREPETVVVFGAGPIGLLTMQVLRHRFGCKVAVIDQSLARLVLAQKLGAEAIFEPSDHGPIHLWAGELGIDATVDAVGAGSTKADSITFLRPGGTAVWIGLHENTSPLNAYDLILPEKRLLGSYACTQPELAEALALIADSVIDVSSWTTKYPLGESEQAFKDMLEPGPGDVKGVIVMI